jgi:L-methionine (R)-S-oxide reductase
MSCRGQSRLRRRFLDGARNNSIVVGVFTGTVSADLSKREVYAELAKQLEALIASETDPVANMANCAALLFNSLPDLNWAGFYLLKGGELVLGPFQGRPACVRIAVGRGVCGKAAKDRVTLRVADVNAFDDHIACDTASRSELVVPLISADRQFLLGVLDIDSPQLNRFDADDEAGLKEIGELIAAKIARV